jgi:hypothetical protein
MDKYSDLAPWILGGIATAAVAAAMTLGGNVRTAPRTLQAPSPPIAAMSPPQLLAEPTPTAAATAPAQSESKDISPAAQPAAAGQIWECTTNGQRTFSNNPCGEKSSLREFGPINTMEATPVPRFPLPYQPEPGYARDLDESVSQDYADEPHQSLVGIPYFVHRRGERTHRPYQRGSGPAPRRN